MTDGERGMCQDPVGRFWADHPRADLRDRVLRRILETDGYGLHFPKLVAEFHGHDAVADATYEYTHLREFVRELEQHGLVRVERVGPQERPQDRSLTVYPLAEAWQVAPPAPGAGVLDTTSGDSRHWSDQSVSKANAAGIYKRRKSLDTCEVVGDAIGALGGHKKGVEGSYGGGERTRFTHLSEALTDRQRVETAFAGGRAVGGVGYVISAGTVPRQTASVFEGANALTGDGGDVSALRRWLGSPPALTVVEPTRRSVAQPHVVVFADPDARPSNNALHSYWLGRGRGFEIRADPIHVDADGECRWSDGRPAEAQGAPPDVYLREGADALVTVASLDADDVLAVADAFRARGDEPVTEDVEATVSAETGVDAKACRWGAFYFGTGVSASTTPSPVLRERAAAGELVAAECRRHVAAPGGVVDVGEGIRSLSVRNAPWARTGGEGGSVFVDRPRSFVWSEHGLLWFDGVPPPPAGVTRRRRDSIGKNHRKVETRGQTTSNQ